MQASPEARSRGHGAQRAQRIAGSVVLLHHHAMGFITVPNIAGRRRLSRHYAFFHAHHVGEEDLLFLHQVDPELFAQRRKHLLHLQQLGMVLAVNADDLLGERLNARALGADEHVMRGGDVGDQVGQQLLLPVFGRPV